MFLLFGYISIALVQLYRQYCRQSRYSKAMLRALRQGSVLVQRGRCAKHGSVGALLNSPLLSCSRSYKETQLLSEDELAISVVSPRQRIDLGEWTSYLDINPSADANNSVIVLLEAGRPDDLDTAVQVPMAQQAHVLQHGCPIAWKCGSPFGIILLCTYHNFVLLCDAFGEGRLILDEDLELYRLLTVSVTGRPQSLKRKSQEVEQIRRIIPHEDESVRSLSSTSSPGFATAEDAKRAKDVSFGKENIPRSRISPSASVKCVDVFNGAASEMRREDGKIMAPLTVDCSGGDIGGCDDASDSLLKTGKKLLQKTYDGSTDVAENLSSGDHNGFSVTQQNDRELTPSKIERSTQQTTHTQEKKNGHSCEVPNGESLTASSNSKADSLQIDKGTHSNDVISSVISDRAESAISKTDGKGSLLRKGTAKAGKPPNVLVYCGIKDSARKFGNIKSCLEQCLNIDAYTLYHLAHEQVTSTPWADNSAALVISCDKLYTNIEQTFSEYLLSGGRVISFGSSMEANFLERKTTHERLTVAKFDFDTWKDVSTIQGCHCYTRGSLKQDNSTVEAVVVDHKTGEPLVVLLTLSGNTGNGCAVFSQLLLERDPAEMAVDSQTFSQLKQSNSDRLQVMRHLMTLLGLDTSPPPAHKLTPCYLLAQKQAVKDSLLNSLGSRMKQGTIKSRSLSLHFVPDACSVSPISTEVLPVVTQSKLDSGKAASDEHVQFFQPEIYWQYLTTSVLGQVVFYTDVIPTTMTVFEGIQFSIPDDVGVIAVAGRQTSGKGRGGNAWLSPVGCAMFTLPLSMPVDSTLGQRCTFLQHIVSLAVVHSVRSLTGYQDVELRLKWPNDIYYRDQMKLGGVLVTSTIMGSKLHATIGCGVNVSNSHPTICINDIIQHHNIETGSNLSLLSSSQMAALTVSAIERLVTHFQVEGPGSFCELYYKYWLHSGAKVQLESENEEVEICGLDDFGFLRVVTKQGRQLSVQPDGNTFDMMHNLIALKRQ